MMSEFRNHNLDMKQNMICIKVHNKLKKKLKLDFGGLMVYRLFQEPKKTRFLDQFSIPGIDLDSRL